MSVSLRTLHEPSFTLRSFAAGLYQVYYMNSPIIVTLVSQSVTKTQCRLRNNGTASLVKERNVQQFAKEDIACGESESVGTSLQDLALQCHGASVPRHVWCHLELVSH